MGKRKLTSKWQNQGKNKTGDFAHAHTHTHTHTQLVAAISIPEAGPIFFVDINPKRNGSGCYIRFDAYMVATTIEEAMQKGMTKADLQHDFNRGFCWFDEGSKKSNGPKKQTHPRIPNVTKS